MTRVQFLVGAKIFLLATMSKQNPGSTSASYPVGYGESFPGSKADSALSDHSPPHSAEVKNVLSYPTTPQYTFMVWCLISTMDNFTFEFIKYVLLYTGPHQDTWVPLQQIIFTFLFNIYLAGRN